MESLKEISEQINYIHTSPNTLDEISVTICDDEIEPGCPTVMISNRGEKVDFALQDMPMLLNLIERATFKLSLYSDRDYFEKNEENLKLFLGETWASIFRNYHEIASNE